MFRPVEALVIPLLGLDCILLDKATMAQFEANSNWVRQESSFRSTQTVIPAIHRMSDQSQQVRVPAVQADGTCNEVDRIYLRPQHGMVVTAYACPAPLFNTHVVVEPTIPSGPHVYGSNQSQPFERVLVARTVSTW